MPTNGNRKPNAFNLVKFSKRLDKTGKDESKLTTIEALNALEDAFTDNKKKCYPHFKVYSNLLKFLSFDEMMVFHQVLNIRGMEKKDHRLKSCDMEWLKTLSSKSAKMLIIAVEKYPTLEHGWFKLAEKRLMRDLGISRDREVRIMERLREKGLLLSFVCGMPRHRWVRLNMKRFLKLARTPNCSESATTPL